MLNKFIIVMMMGAVLAGPASADVPRPEAVKTTPSKSTIVMENGEPSGYRGETRIIEPMAKTIEANGLMFVTAMSKCPAEEVTLADVRFVPSGDSARWREEWLYDVCSSQKYMMPVLIRPDPKGKAQIEIVLADIAKVL